MSAAPGVGILVGCDAQQEWLLPWWWSKYSEHNAYPVTFADFGMSAQAQAWCRNLGELVSVPDPMDALSGKTDVPPALAALWESIYKAGVWTLRRGWFKKPLAATLSPYRKTLWLDLDCEVLGPLAALFQAGRPGFTIALAQEPAHTQLALRAKNMLCEHEILYNSGVILFEPTAAIIQHWAAAALAHNAEFVGDQNLLSRLIFQQRPPLMELPAIYNWRIFANHTALHEVVPPDTLIIHWAGDWGKHHIRIYGGLGPEFRQFLASLRPP